VLAGAGWSIARKVDWLYTQSLHSIDKVTEDFPVVRKCFTLVSLLTLLFAAQDFAHGGAVRQSNAGGSNQSPAFALPIVKRDSLLNGLQLTVMEQRGTGSISLRLRINSGAMFDLSNKGGLADLTAGMLLKGGGGFNARAVSETVEQLGITMSVTVGWDSTDIVVSGPADSLAAVFELLGRIVVTPSFDQKELDELKAARVAAIKAEAGDDRQAVRDKAIEQVFGGHPYGRPPRGTAQSVAQITRADLVYFHKRFYLANNAQLFITGDVAPEDVTKLARTRLGSWKKGEKIPATFRPPEAQSGLRLFVIGRPQAQVAHAAVTQIGFSRRANDFLPALLLSDILKQSVMNLTVSGKTADVEAAFDARTLPGPLAFEIEAAPDAVVEAIEAVLARMASLQANQPAPDQLELAKSRVVSTFAERLRSPDGAAQIMLDIELYGLGRDYLVNFVERVNAITPADVLRAAQNYLKPQSVAIVVAGPPAVIETALKKHGPVTLVQ
jgi:zinc protease